jgi:AcrR family transcriptional regulator
MTDTQQKILDAAERLISQQGYAATSLRQIIAEAGVNLASVHYHFGSKEELLDEVVMRKAGPVNEERMAMLDRAEAECGPGRAVPVEKVLEAFLAPAFYKRGESPQFVRLMGRLYGEGLMMWIVTRHFQPMVQRFQAALRRSLPELGPEELKWRTHFMIGVMAHTMFGPPEGQADGVREVELLVERMVAFLAAGFHAPARQGVPVEVE